MTTAEKRKLNRIIDLLDKAAAMADEMDLTLSNGGFVGCIIGTISDELSLRVTEEQ